MVMFIFAAHIESFRSVADCWMFPNEGVNVLLGPNNSGKTTLLRACGLALDPQLNWFREDVITRFDFPNGDTSTPIRVRVWLKPHENETADVKTKLFDKLSKWTVNKVEGNPAELTPMVLEPYDNKNVLQHEELLAVLLEATWDADAQVAQVELSIFDEMGTTKAPFSAAYRRLIDFRFFQTRRNPVYQLSLAKRSLLSHYLEDKELGVILQNLLGLLESSKSMLVGHDQLRKVLEQLHGLIAPGILSNLMGGSEAEFTLTFLNSDVGKLRTATSLAVEFETDGLAQQSPKDRFALPLEYQGDGVQNLLFLLSVADAIRNTDSRSIVVVEEPEQNLEPALARWVFGELCAGGSNGPNQVFITTHSPTLAGELRGADSLLLIPVRVPQEENGGSVVRSARYLPQEIRKQFEHNRSLYAPTLFARHVLVVEGDSELGLLPVAFRHLSIGRPEANPFHLGLEIINGSDREQVIKHGINLAAFGRSCHLLIDYDHPRKVSKTTAQLIEYAQEKGLMVSCWGNRKVLPFTEGVDLEVILVEQVPPDVLFEAIKVAYHDAGHILQHDKWTKARNLVEEEAIRTMLPGELPGLENFELDTLPDEISRKAFLFALLHGPHSCKSTKDMRIIAEQLAENDAFPPVLDKLRARIVATIMNSEKIAHDQPYLIKS